MSRERLPVSAREAAFKVLGEYRRKKTWPEQALVDVIGRYGLSTPDASLAAQIVYGVLQNMALCDYYTACFSSVGLKKIEPRVLDVLRLSIYQIAFLTRVPRSAAVNEGVGLVRKFSNPQAAGFVNAVLRKASDAAASGKLPDVGGDTLRRLSVMYSHPEWLVSEFLDELGQKGAEALLRANNAPDTPVTVQVNTQLATADEALSALRSDGVEAIRHEWLADCLELRGAGSITRLEAFMKGYIYVQDAAARLAVTAAGLKKGDIVIDGCAAPGGKSFAAAIMMGNSGRVFSLDKNPEKLARIKGGAKRMGLGIIEATANDAAAPLGEHIGIADAVLADVPCSGFGVIRKKPEIRYKPKQELVSLAGIQGGILSGLSACVKPGGVLLYSTCTILRRENEGVVEQFLRENRSFEPEGFSLPGAGSAPNGMMTLWPHKNRTDGFFICKLRKEAPIQEASGKLHF
jgi:16S rRNA (cytosine967-C5)-methyltransferase